MAQQEAATAHATDHDDHGHHGRDPAEDSRFIGLLLVVVGLGLALGIGRQVPGVTSQGADVTSFEGIVTQPDGHELRGLIELHDDLIKVKKGKSHYVLHRGPGVHVRRVDTSPRQTRNGIVVLRSGQVFVGELLQRPQDVVVDGLAFPRERVRWVEAGTETLSDAYWAKFPRGELDARYQRERPDLDEQSRVDPPVAPTPTRSPREVVKDPFHTPPANHGAPSLSEPALDFDDGETKAERIKRLVDRASLRQMSLDWPAAAQTWRDAYLESGKTTHRRNLETCLVRWVSETPPQGNFQRRLEMMRDVVDPVKMEVRATLAACYLTTFQSLRPKFHMEGLPEQLAMMGTLHERILELGEFIDPSLREGIADLESFLAAYNDTPAPPSEDFQLEQGHGDHGGHGDHDGHDH